VTIERHGKRMTILMRPIWDPTQKPARMRLGFAYNFNGGPHQRLSFGEAINQSTSVFWNVTKKTVSIPAKIIDPKQRKEINGIVGSYETTRQTIIADAGDVIGIMAIISISLALVNLFPFLPLDGGHIFWAVVEKIRRKPVPYSTMERSGIIGFALVLFLFAIGLSNDIGQLSNGGFKPR
jgi:regulator of sigma E protease